MTMLSALPLARLGNPVRGTTDSATGPDRGAASGRGRAREDELALLVQNLQDELGAGRRELDDLRRSNAR